MRAETLRSEDTYVVNSMALQASYRSEIVVDTLADVKMPHQFDTASFPQMVVCVPGRHQAGTISSQQQLSKEAVFQNLADQWRLERGATSSITQMAMCRSYQRIIAMGAVAVPLILSDLAVHPDNPDHWFWALQMLTGDDPVPENARGDMRRMAAAWLEWGGRSGHAAR